MRQLAQAVFAALLALSLPAHADSSLTRLSTLDQSRRWEAVGRLNLGDRGFCTAALIAPDVVLTAAHCLYDKTKGERFPVGEMRFLADWRMGRAAAYRGVRRAVTLPDYSFAEADRLDRVGNDLALVQLDRPIRLPSIRPFPIGEGTGTGEAVGVVSYAADRADAPSLQQTCHVIGRRTGVFVLSCDIDFGSSGAPVFAEEGGQTRIVSVISAKAEAEGKRVSLGVDLEGRVADLMALLAADDPATLTAAGPGAQAAQAAPKVIRLGGSAGGAKFVRP